MSFSPAMQSFLDDLATLKGAWYFEPSDVSKPIRHGDCKCPLQVLTGVDVLYMQRGKEKYNLTDREVDLVIGAADYQDFLDEKNCYTEDSREYLAAHKELRAAMLAATGLDNPTP